MIRFASKMFLVFFSFITSFISGLLHYFIDQSDFILLDAVKRLEIIVLWAILLSDS